MNKERLFVVFVVLDLYNWASAIKTLYSTHTYEHFLCYYEMGLTKISFGEIY